MAKNIIETVIFELNEGVNRDDFAAAAENMSAWVLARPGFINRRLSCNGHGKWVEHIQWRDIDAARAAAAEIGKDPGNAEFLSAINGATVQLMHSELEVAIN